MSDKFRKPDPSMFRPKGRFERPLHGRHLSSPVYQRCGMKRPALELQRRKWRQMRLAIRVQTEAYHDSEAYRESLAIAQRLAHKWRRANRVFQLTFGLLAGLLLFYGYDGFSNPQPNALLTAWIQSVPESQPKPVTSSTCAPVALSDVQVPIITGESIQKAVSAMQARQSGSMAELAYDMNFKVRELTKGTGNNISNVRVDIDNGSYIGFTDANGVAHIPQIPAGNHTINMSKEGYLEFTQANYNLNGNKTFNASIPAKTQTGPWGTTTLNADWYKATFIDAQDAGATGQDPYHWAQIIPINNRIVNATKADSALVLQAISALETNTGYDLINVVNVPYDENSNYNINMNANTDFSIVGTDETGTIIAGDSYITSTYQMKRVIHEIVKQFDMWPMQEPVMYPSVMDPAQQTMTDPQPYDYMHIWLTISEHLAKSRGEQNMFLGNMYNYSELITPTKTTITNPINNATDLDKIVRLKWNNIIDANKYNINIATDENFTNIVYDLNAQRIDTTLTLAEDTKYYMRVRAENTTGNATWSDIINFTTKPKINHAPTTFTFTKPLNNERIEYTNKNLVIETTVPTDQDNDPLTKTIHLVGEGIDTLIYTKATTQTIYIESKKLKLNTQYTLTGEVTDGKTTTQATNIVTFKTPTGVGLEELIPKNNLKIYPNPTTNYINIEAQIQQPLTINIELYDITGKKVIQEKTEKTYNEYRQQIDITKLPTGIYLLNIEAKTENNETRRQAIKIIKW